MVVRLSENGDNIHNTDSGDKSDNSDNSDKSNNSDNCHNSDNNDNSENGDNSDSSQVKMEVSLPLSECLLKQTICLYPETAKEKENAWGIEIGNILNV